MRVHRYTEKSVAQCLSAINERMQIKGTNSRPGMDGWVEKSGAFAISITTPVFSRFKRKTTLYGKIERKEGYTLVRADVPTGADLRGTLMMIGVLVLMSAFLIASGNALMALILIPAAVWLYIPMRGDYENSEALISDLERTLKAKEAPPKRATETAKTRAKAS